MIAILLWLFMTGTVEAAEQCRLYQSKVGDVRKACEPELEAKTAPTVELSVADFTKVARTVELQRQAIATSKKLDAVKTQHIRELNEALKSCETIGNDQDQLIVQAKAALDAKEKEVQSWKAKSERQTYGVWASVGLAVAAVVFAFAK